MSHSDDKHGRGGRRGARGGRGGRDTHSIGSRLHNAELHR